MSMQRHEYILYGFLALFGVALIAVYVVEMYYFERMFRVGRLFGVGVLIGVGLGVLVARYFRNAEDDLTDRIQTYVFFIVLAAIFTPLLVSLSNRWLITPRCNYETVEFFEEVPNGHSVGMMSDGETVRYSAYYLYFFRDDRLYRIENHDPISEQQPPEQGTQIEIPICRGIWGIQWVGEL
jgi:hypothetical protein